MHVRFFVDGVFVESSDIDLHTGASVYLTREMPSQDSVWCRELAWHVVRVWTAALEYQLHRNTDGSVPEIARGSWVQAPR